MWPLFYLMIRLCRDLVGPCYLPCRLPAVSSWPTVFLRLRSTELETFERATYTSCLIMSREGAFVVEMPLSCEASGWCAYIFSIFFSTSSTIIWTFFISSSDFCYYESYFRLSWGLVLRLYMWLCSLFFSIIVVWSSCLQCCIDCYLGLSWSWIGKMFF